MKVITLIQILLKEIEKHGELLDIDTFSGKLELYDNRGNNLRDVFIEKK